MKQLLIIVLFLLCSCSNNESTLQHNIYLTDSCKINNISYSSKCYINQSNAILIFHREKVFKDTSFNNNIMYIKDTVLGVSKIYKYSINQFANILKEKVSLNRETSTLQYNDNMYCTWNYIDKLYLILYGNI